MGWNDPDEFNVRLMSAFGLAAKVDHWLVHMETVGIDRAQAATDLFELVFEHGWGVDESMDFLSRAAAYMRPWVADFSSDVPDDSTIIGIAISDKPRLPDGELRRVTELEKEGTT